MSNYVVRALKFTCIADTGPDWGGTDDAYWIFTALDPGGQQTKTMRSQVFAEVIPGGTRLFPPNIVVWPKQGDIDGAPGPIALSVQLWEEDHGSAEATRKTTEQELSAVRYLPHLTDWAAQVASVVGLAVVGAVDDEVMGAKRLFPAVQAPKAAQKSGGFLH